MRLALALLLFVAACTSAHPPVRQSASPTAILTVSEIPEVVSRVGAATRVAVSVVVADGYHVQANPASGEFLIPFELELESTQNLEIGTTTYPEPTPHRLEGTENPLATYTGRFQVEVPITALTAGRYEVQGKVSYQACDRRRCLFPTTQPVAFTVLAEGRPDSALGDER